MGMQRGFARTTMKRTRYGATDVMIAPAWLKIYPTGVRKIIITFGVEVGITAEVRVKATADVAVGDFLYEQARGQRFYVYQLISEQATVLLMCQQVPKLIGDEFDNLQIEGFWSQRLNGGAFNEATHAGQLWLTPPVLGAGSRLASNGGLIYQTISCDFDVMAQLAVTNNVAVGEYNWGYLGARISGSALGVYIGVRGRNGNADVMRINQYDAAAQDKTTDAPGTVNFVRVRRVGVVFHLYKSGNGSASVPSKESDWTAVDPVGQEVSSGADVEWG